MSLTVILCFICDGKPFEFCSNMQANSQDWGSVGITACAAVALSSTLNEGVSQTWVRSVVLSYPLGGISTAVTVAIPVAAVMLVAAALVDFCLFGYSLLSV